MEIATPRLDLLAIQNSIHLQGVDLTDKSKVLAAALATALSRHIALPSGDVEFPDTYYTQNLAINVIGQIGDINEKVLLDVHFAKDLTKNLYMVRLAAAYPKAQIAPVSPFDFFCTYSNVHMRVDQTTYEFLAKYKTQILNLSNQFCEVICGA